MREEETTYEVFSRACPLEPHRPPSGAGVGTLVGSQVAGRSSGQFPRATLDISFLQIPNATYAGNGDSFASEAVLVANRLVPMRSELKPAGHPCAQAMRGSITRRKWWRTGLKP